MPKRYSRKFWITFWAIAVLFLAGWFLFWQLANHRRATLNSAISILPINQEKKDDLEAINYFVDYILKKDGQEKTFLVLFQNNMELRPGGGYIGSFGILKMKDGQIVDLQTNDVVNFDGRIPDTEEPPYPLKETLGLSSWKLRDSNFSPDFPTDAQKADYFYHLGQGQENLDGIVAINADVLTSFLKVTGPVSIDGFPGTYDSENAIMSLEYQVEKGYQEQGLAHAERKSVMNSLADEIIKKATSLNETDKLKLAQIILDNLNNKDIQLYFKDSPLEEQAQKAGWSGEVDQSWGSDYLMMVDANLGSYKSDYYIKRSFDYTIDLSGDIPKADLKITYTHTAKEKDWMTKDYLTYLRVYVPNGAWFDNSAGPDNATFGEELGHKYIASLITVPIGQTKTFQFNYNLPQNIKDKPYDLLIQKESGVGTIPGHITIIKKDGARETHDIELKGDWQLN
jgi:hypothetical protein